MGREEVDGGEAHPSVGHGAQGCPTGGGDIQAGLERGGKTDSVKRRFGILLYSTWNSLDIMRQPEWEGV